MTVKRYLQNVGRIIWALSLLGGICSAQMIQAATYYVALGGDDSNPGTETQPFRSIGRGAGVLTAGDTLYVREGTYHESFWDSIPSGSSWDAPVTIAAFAGETVTIRPDPGADRVFLFQGEDTHHIIIDGFILDATNVSYDVVKIADASDPYTDVAYNIRIKNSELKNGPFNGLLVTGSGNEFINLRIHDNGMILGGHAMYIASAENLIDGCEIHDNAGWGVHVYDQYTNRGMVNDNVIRNSKIYRNGLSGRGEGIILSSGSGNQAYNNEIWENLGGIQIDYGASDTHVYDNVIYRNSYFGIYIGPRSFNAVVESNEVYDNDGPEIADDGSGTLILH